MKIYSNTNKLIAEMKCKKRKCKYYVYHKYFSKYTCVDFFIDEKTKDCWDCIRNDVILKDCFEPKKAGEK